MHYSGVSESCTYDRSLWLFDAVHVSQSVLVYIFPINAVVLCKLTLREG